MFRVANHAVIETGADGDQDVAILHRHVRFISAMHAGHADILLARGAVAAQAHQGVGARETQAVNQLVQLGSRIREDHAAARVDHRTFGLQQQLHGLADLARVALVNGTVGTHFDFLRIVEMAFVHADILGDIDQHGSRTAGTGDEEGFLDRRCQVLDVLDEEIVLDHGAGDADRVAFLERILSDGVARHLAGDHHHGNRVHVRGRQARDGIRDARTGRDDGDTDFVRAARIGIGGVDRGLLVAYQDMLEFVLLEDGVVDVEYGSARVSKDVLDALFSQTAHDNFCARNWSCCCFGIHETFLSRSIGD